MNDIDILSSCLSGDELEKALKKYRSGIPAAYILGEWEFFGDRYVLNSDCLIPRCDTERVAETVLEQLSDGKTLADLCTGSGCIAISCLKRRKASRGVAVDISKGAVDAARENARINGVSDRLKIINSDVFKLPLGDERFDVIVSNPPYIPTKDIEELDLYVKKEPSLALDGGDDGMIFYNFFLEHYGKNLKDGGVFIFEIGYDQEEAIKLSAEKHGYSCKVTKDYSGNPRVALIIKNTLSEDL